MTKFERVQELKQLDDTVEHDFSLLTDYVDALEQAIESGEFSWNEVNDCCDNIVNICEAIMIGVTDTSSDCE